MKQAYWLYFISGIVIVLAFLTSWAFQPTTFDCGSIGRLEVTRVTGNVALESQGKRHEGRLDGGKLSWSSDGVGGSEKLPASLTMGSTNHRIVTDAGTARSVACDKI